jgi:hypothetical protein
MKGHDDNTARIAHSRLGFADDQQDRPLNCYGRFPEWKVPFTLAAPLNYATGGHA